MPFDTPLDFKGWLYDISGVSIHRFQLRVLCQLATGRYTDLSSRVIRVSGRSMMMPAQLTTMSGTTASVSASGFFMASILVDWVNSRLSTGTLGKPGKCSTDCVAEAATVPAATPSDHVHPPRSAA